VRRLLFFPGHRILAYEWQAGAFRRIEAFEPVVVARLPIELPEKPLENVGHEIPRRARVESEAVAFEHTRMAAEGVVLLVQLHVDPGVGEEGCRRESAEPAANNDYLL